ncbi:Ribokinase-like protein [Obelidium mucronatum]|nr:Ribokinase-like protein [Obelidium mucronatum]
MLRTSSIVTAIRTRIPPLYDPIISTGLHKGQSGRILIVGGSEEYTGAPYYAGIAALRTGADICHIICHPLAAPALKSYSPELIVHPVLGVPNQFESIINVLKRVHVVVVGPGLSRQDQQLEEAKRVIVEARRMELALVIDADGLFLVQQEPELVTGYLNCILTPNHVEFERLCKQMNIAEEPDLSTRVSKLSKSLGGVMVVCKGSEDIISDGTNWVGVKESGSPRRCGGQGDILAGSIATFVSWTKGYKQGLYTSSTSVDEKSVDVESMDGTVTSVGLVALACAAACVLVRKASRRAFDMKGRATSATAMIEYLGQVFSESFDQVDFKKRN